MYRLIETLIVVCRPQKRRYFNLRARRLVAVQRVHGSRKWPLYSSSPAWTEHPQNIRAAKLQSVFDSSKHGSKKNSYDERKVSKSATRNTLQFTVFETSSEILFQIEDSVSSSCLCPHKKDSASKRRRSGSRWTVIGDATLCILWSPANFTSSSSRPLRCIFLFRRHPRGSQVCTENTSCLVGLLLRYYKTQRSF